MKTTILIALFLVSGAVMAQEPSAAEVCGEWRNHLHNDDERSAFDRICSGLGTSAASPPSTSADPPDDLATTEETELWVQLLDSGNPYAPISAGLLVDEDFLGEIEIKFGPVTCHLFDEYLLAGEWAFVRLCDGPEGLDYLSVPATLRVKMQEDWDDPSYFYRCVESSARQEEGRRNYACALLDPPESIVPTEMQVHLLDSDNPYAPIAARFWIDVDFLGNVEIKAGEITCHIFEEYLPANEWAFIPICNGPEDLDYLAAPETFLVEMQEDWGEPASFFRCDESTDESEEERRIYTCEFLRRR